MEKLTHLSNLSFILQTDQVLDTTSHGKYATLCKHILGLPSTHSPAHAKKCPPRPYYIHIPEGGRYISWPAPLIFCDCELKKGNAILEIGIDKRIVSTCAQPHLDRNPVAWLHLRYYSLHMYSCNYQNMEIPPPPLHPVHFKQDVRVFVSGTWLWIHEHQIWLGPWRKSASTTLESSRALVPIPQQQQQRPPPPAPAPAPAPTLCGPASGSIWEKQWKKMWARVNVDTAKQSKLALFTLHLALMVREREADLRAHFSDHDFFQHLGVAPCKLYGPIAWGWQGLLPLRLPDGTWKFQNKKGGIFSGEPFLERVNPRLDCTNGLHTYRFRDEAYEALLPILDLYPDQKRLEGKNTLRHLCRTTTRKRKRQPSDGSTSTPPPPRAPPFFSSSTRQLKTKKKMKKKTKKKKNASRNNTSSGKP